MISIDRFTKSKHCSSGLDKLHGQKIAKELEHYGSEVETHSDKSGEERRKKMENIIGKHAYRVDKGEWPLSNFFDEIQESSPEEILPVGEEVEEIRFTDFSIYRFKDGYAIYMDAKEVILPPKTKQERGSPRLYIIAYDRKIYNLPVLEYPKSIAPFLKWLKKKKKLSYTSAPTIWNGDKTKTLYDKSGNIDWVALRYDCSCYGYPIKNLKTKEDIDDYNSWLMGKYKADVEKHNKTNGDFRRISDPTKLNPIEIDITQVDVNEFIDSWNNKYQVKR